MKAFDRAVLMLLFAALAVLAGCQNKDDLQASAAFPSSQGLEAGMPVRIAGFDVGKVTEVDVARDGRGVEAKLRISAKYRDRVFAPPETVVELRRESTLFGSGYLEIVNGGTTRAEDGAVFVGKTISFEDLARRATDLAKTAAGEAEHFTKSLEGRIREALSSDDAKHFDAKIKELISAIDVASSNTLHDAGGALGTALLKAKGLVEGLDSLPREKIADNLDQALSELHRAQTALTKLGHKVVVDTVRGDKQTTGSAQGS